MNIGLPRAIPLQRLIDPVASLPRHALLRPPVEFSVLSRAPGLSLAAWYSGVRAPLSIRQAISFDDPQAYERVMGAWSSLVGEPFLDWLAPASGLRWLDAGCGNGAFTRLIARRCAPASIHGLDTEPAQIDDARRRQGAGEPHITQFRIGDVTDMPYAPASFDVGVMALVLVLLPDPARGVAEMIRMLAPGGLACAYNWDLHGRGSPLAPLNLAMRQAGVPTPAAPSEGASREEVTRRLWIDAGLRQVQTHAITVQRHFDSFEQAWEVSQLGTSAAPVLRSLSHEKREEIKDRFRDNLQQDTSGPVTCTARAIAVRGVVGR